MQNIKPSQTVRRQLLSALVLGSFAGAGATATGQESCCFEPAYRLECETVMQPEVVQRMRLTYETEMVEEEVTSFRPVLKTRVEEREYRVAKPVTETSFREERYTVYKPVDETSWRDETVTQTRYVQETAEREEKVTTFKPVTETQMYQQRYTVQRPVTETQMYQQQYTVQRPVTETQMRTDTVTSYRPVTTMQTQTVNAGAFVPQTTVTPGSTGVTLGWNPNAYLTPGPLGIFYRRRGAAVAVPVTTPAQVQTQMVYRPNWVQQQVAQTSYVPETQQVQRPVTVTKLQQEVVTQNVPVQVQRMQSEVVTKNVPVQRTRMVPQTTVRKIPYTVQRPITETLTRKVPVQNRRWVAEQQVRKVPVQSTRMVYETRREPITVKYYEQEEVRRKVMRPVTVPKYEPYQVTRMVPKQVVQRLPLSYVDPFSPAIRSGYSSFSPIIESTPAPTTSYSYPSTDYPGSSSIVTQPEDSSVRSNRISPDDDGVSVLEPPAQSDSSQPQSRLGDVQFGAPERDSAGDMEELEDMFDNSRGLDTLPDPRDSDEIEPPAIDSREAGFRIWRSDRLPFRSITHRVKWNPTFAREL